MRLLLIVFIQALLLLWMYHVALVRNHTRLRYYISQQYCEKQRAEGALWICGGYGVHGFQVCDDCVRRVMA